MSLHDKFAHIAALRPARGYSVITPRDVQPPSEYDQLAQLLGAQIRKNDYGEHLSLQQWHATPEMCTPDSRSLSLLWPAGVPIDQALLDAATDPEQWLFLDTETTGLAGGSGTYAFMVGIAWWDAGGLQLEQFFMRDLDEEHSLLFELAHRMAERPVLVTFNGKSFDWPLLETRYRMTRAIPACAPLLHLDFLHSARQLWRLRLGSVRLQELERHVLHGEPGINWSRDDDINSSLIPQMYFDYLRGGSAVPLTGVFRHNQMDLRGLAALAGKVLNLFDTGNGFAQAPHHSAHNAVDLCGLSRVLHRRGNTARARALYESALESGLPRTVERLAQRELAQLAKRELDYERATTLWEELCDPSGEPDSADGAFNEEARSVLEASVHATEQLAIYYEHRAKNYPRAAELVSSALEDLRGGQIGGVLDSVRGRRIEQRLATRLARLERRIASAKPTRARRASQIEVNY